MGCAQQRVAMIGQLDGAAREPTRSMSYRDMAQGGFVNWQQRDAASCLLSKLASQFGPLGEESRLEANRELFEFAGLRNENHWRVSAPIPDA